MGKMRKNFLRKKEDFECQVCGTKVKGDGYTDHCPQCLWGKHVDKNLPGDRESSCRGLMRPEGAVWEKGQYRIFYRCESCGHGFWVREGKEDKREELERLTGRIFPEISEGVGRRGKGKIRKGS